MYHGKGKFTNAAGDVFEGNFSEGVRKGAGVLKEKCNLELTNKRFANNKFFIFQREMNLIAIGKIVYYSMSIIVYF